MSPSGPIGLIIWFSESVGNARVHGLVNLLTYWSTLYVIGHHNGDGHYVHAKCDCLNNYVRKNHICKKLRGIGF